MEEGREGSEHPTRLMLLIRSSLLQCVAAIALSVTAAFAIAQPFPGKTVRFISPFAPGGGNDIMARMLAAKLTEPWGHQVIVENRPGANTIVAMQVLANSAPDGHTIFMASTTLAINATLY